MVRDSAKHGVDGQVGVASGVPPISTIRADAGEAHTNMASTAPAAAIILGRRSIPAFNTTDRPGLWWPVAGAFRSS